MTRDIIASTLVYDAIDLMAREAQLGEPLSPELYGDLQGRLRDIAEHVMALEAIARSVELVGRREFMTAATSLPVEDRRALARSALQASRGTLLRFPDRFQPGPHRGGDAA